MSDLKIPGKNVLLKAMTRISGYNKTIKKGKDKDVTIQARGLLKVLTMVRNGEKT